MLLGRNIIFIGYYFLYCNYEYESFFPKRKIKEEKIIIFMNKNI